MLHTVECVKATRALEQAIEIFDRKYPRACRTCGGLGWTNDPDHSVGMDWNPVPCIDCEDRPAERGGPICGLCGRPGDFSGRTLEGDSEDVRPCVVLMSYTTLRRSCDVYEERPQHDDCGCRFIIDEHEIRYPEPGVIMVDGTTYEFAADDRAYDEARDRAATRR